MTLSTPIRRVIAATTATTALMMTAPLAVANAHHGWAEFDTTAAYYVAGTITDVAWADPHVEVTMRVEDPNVPAGLANRELPGDLEQIGGRDTLRVTRNYDGGQPEMHLVLAPIGYLQRWGLDRRLQSGERMEAVGFLNREHADEFRPEVIFVNEAGAIRQRLVALPEPPVAASRPDADPTMGSEPAATGRPGRRDSSDAAVWAVTGAVVFSAAAGGWWYLRRQNRPG